MKKMIAWVAVLVAAFQVGLAAQAAVTADTGWYVEGDDSFTIHTEEQLAGFAQLVNAGTSFEGKTVVLGTDIALTEAWSGIGVYNDTAVGTAFQGTFDGNGKKISNVTFANTSANKYRGFFNQIYRATVKNVTIESKGFEASTTGSYGGAVIVGHAIGSTIENCVAEGSFAGTHNVAGIVVLIQGSTIKNCTNKAALSNDYSKLAGIVNFSQHKGVDANYKGSLIEGCVNEGLITSTGGGADGVGGIIGWIGYGDGVASSDAAYAVTIKNCENKGAIAYTGTALSGQIVGSGESYLVDGGSNKGLAGASGIGSDNQGQYFAYATVESGVATYTQTLEAGNTYLVTAKGAKPVVSLAAGESITFDQSLATIDASGITAATALMTQENGKAISYSAASVVIGTTGYATLQEAINAAEAGETVALSANVHLTEMLTIAADKNFTLDLAGFAITVDMISDTNHLYAFENYGTLTLMDSVGIGSITARGVKNRGTMVMTGGAIINGDANGGFGVWNYGIFTMNGGLLKSTCIGHSSGQNTASCLKLEAGSTATLSGGTIESVSVRTYAVNSSGTLIIPEGSTISVKAPRAVAIDDGVATINGGTFETFDARNSGENGAHVAAEIYYPLYVAGGKVTVTDGEFIAPVVAGEPSHSLMINGDKAEVVLDGGTYNRPARIDNTTAPNLTKADAVELGTPEGFTWENGKLVKVTNWAQVADTSWYNETDSEFTLTTAKQLAGVAELVNEGKTFADKTITLGKDLNLAELVWSGIGVYKDDTKSFQGTFDGAGKTISGVTFADASNGDASSEANNYRGFFNQIDNATVRNVTVAGDIWKTAPNSTEYGGALIAGCANNSTIEGCVAEGSVNGTHNVAGIVVRIKDSMIVNCVNKADLTGSYSKMGGIAALVQNSGTSVLFDGCVNEGSITSTARGEDGVGGIVGWVGYPNTENITIKNCENKGEITATGAATVGQIAAESWNGNHVFEGNKGLATMVATGHAAMDGLNYAVVTDGVANYVKTLEAGNTYLVTAPTTKPVVKLGYNEFIAFDTSLVEIDASGITADVEVKISTEGNTTTYTAELSNWSQVADTSWYNGTDSEFTLTTAEQLAGLAKLVNEGNTFSGKTIKLGADIDLKNIEWTPIGMADKAFNGTFDGQEHTVSNLVINSTGNNVGFIGNAYGCKEIKNLTIHNANVTGTSYVGVVVGNLLGKASNCHVSGAINLKATNRYVGCIAGWGYMKVDNCSAIASPETGSVKGIYAGGIVGFLAEGDNRIENCVVENIHIDSIAGAGSIAGMAHYGVTIADNSSKNVTIQTRYNSTDFTGLVAGQNGGSTQTSYIVNNTVENVTATDNDTVITQHAAPTGNTVVGTGVTFDDAGKVTGGTFEVAPPSSVIADGLEVKSYDDGTFGVGIKVTNWIQVADVTWYDAANPLAAYTLDSAEQLAGVAKLVNDGITTFEGVTIKLGGDMDLSAYVWPSIGIYKDNTKSFQGTFDGAGKTISGVTFADASNGNAVSEANNYRGFFNQIDNATVKNVTVAGDVWKTAPASTEYGGALIAGCANNSTIENCVAEGSVNGTHNVAGVVVRVKDSTIKNCTNKADLTGSYSKMGGVAALVQNSETGVLFDGCVNEGNITSTARGEDGVGGIVGWIGYPNTENITVQNCENKGYITVTGAATVGQIAAESWNGGHVFTGNKGLATMLATGHSAMDGLNYATVEDGVATYVTRLRAGNAYLVTAPAPKPVIALKGGESITFDQSLELLADETGITAVNGMIVKSEEGSFVTFKAVVAQIVGSDVEYGSLQEAIDAAIDANGDTVKLLGDTDESVVIAKSAMTLDLNGSTVAQVTVPATASLVVDDTSAENDGAIVKLAMLSGASLEKTDAVAEANIGIPAGYAWNGNVLEANGYTVTIEQPDGPTTEAATHGSSLLLAPGEKEGYTFVGWTSADGTFVSAKADETIVVEGNMTITPIYVPTALYPALADKVIADHTAEIALDNATIAVENGNVTVGIQLQKATSLAEGETTWTPIPADEMEGVLEDDGTMKVTLPADGNKAFFKFVPKNK